MDTLDGTSFAGQLRGYRLAAGLTQAELAERSGLSLRAISDLERGVKRAPRPRSIALLASTLGLSQNDTVRLARAVSRRRGPQRSSPSVDRPAAM
jgi:transcriptional regulator with XRE-family HTH domain